MVRSLRAREWLAGKARLRIVRHRSAGCLYPMIRFQAEAFFRVPPPGSSRQGAELQHAAHEGGKIHHAMGIA
jgi:hypothetical protein